MVRTAGQEGMYAVYLLQQHHESQFVLHGVAPQAKHMVTSIPQRLSMAICRPNQEGNMFDRLELPAAHPAFKLSG